MQNVNGYLISHKIGECSMGEVYLAEDYLGRKKALKVLSPQFSRDPEMIKRFKIEANRLANLNHPSIVILYSFYDSNGTYWMALEYAIGKTLKEIIKESQLDEKKIINNPQQYS